MFRKIIYLPPLGMQLINACLKLIHLYESSGSKLHLQEILIYSKTFGQIQLESQLSLVFYYFSYLLVFFQVCQMLKVCPNLENL